MSNGFVPSAKLCTLPQHPPLVSLIVLTCNRPGFLHLALELAAAQTYPNLEVVVVDDGTHAIQRSQLRRHDKLQSTRLVRLAARASIGAKRNAGVRAAKGQVLLTWDDDDLHPPDQVASLACPIVTNRSELTALSFSYLSRLTRRDALFFHYGKGRGGSIETGAYLGSLAFHRTVAEEALSHTGGRRLLAGSDAIRPYASGARLRAAAAAAPGPFPDTSLAEDLHFVERALNGCHRMLVVPGVPLVYTRHASVHNTWQVNFTGRMAPSQAVPPPSFVNAAIHRQYVQAEADAARRGACVVIHRYPPPDLPRQLNQLHYPDMPSKCCHGSGRRHTKAQLRRPCAPSASECSATFCGQSKGECSASCLCPEERWHGAPGTSACGLHCCRYWRDYWREHPGACTSLKATRPLKVHACQKQNEEENHNHAPVHLAQRPRHHDGRKPRP